MSSDIYRRAFHTDEEPLVVRSAEWARRESADLQLVTRTSPPVEATTDPIEVTPTQLINQLADAGKSPSCSLLCEIELTRFEQSQYQDLLPLLWQYILDHRNSNGRDELVAVGSAIRKYIAVMPMEQMGKLAVLLEAENRSPLPIELEIEVAKMVYRNYEVHPPVSEDPHPELAQQLLEIVQVYTIPRILRKDKHPAAASLAIVAIFSMRSPLATPAWQAAAECGCGWFAELVSDDLDNLHERWSSKSGDAAAWLVALRNDIEARA